ncbi:DNA repair protein RAD50, ABC-type ATPase/SMC superfamily [Trachipleistophora hominis]|uniref:DNA repair protein RAD50, ABC-type ATPase/SMC superfamily n=1 Tax=Trachipleistophora hominis TaxID=72359 RepID=L7JTE3_TRAHO|nr:DNA repair protein RAD50, ABC-type ATPase/SMC superfamily [Trachipleistophora hominis]
MILNKLMIKGIRSYSPSTSNVIQFFPMTLILGENGTGKTTIIEALRYAITGDLPPMSRGGAFVYDPTLSNSTDTNAQIKLKLCDRYVVSRSLSLTHRKSKIEQKNTENVFSVIVNDSVSESYGNNMENLCNNDEVGNVLGWKKEEETNDRTKNTETKRKMKSLSGKAADIDKQMLMVLNTNKPLLDHVIFCHQEESTWPLSEPANFKKRMDDIFCSTVYIKAVENLKNVRKDKNVQLKMKLQELNFALQAKKKHKELLARLERANEDFMNNSGVISNLQSKLQVLNEKLCARHAIKKEINVESEKLLVLDVKLRNLKSKSMEIVDDEVVNKYRICAG